MTFPSTIRGFVLAIAALPFIASASPVVAKPTIEVAFVLDTTGSMSNLIEGAKRKIWSIATAIADGNADADIRMGLVAYRDIGDDYVTRTFDLGHSGALWESAVIAGARRGRLARKRQRGAGCGGQSTQLDIGRRGAPHRLFGR